jgi:hypothetical protein
MDVTGRAIVDIILTGKEEDTPNLLMKGAIGKAS